MKKIILMVVVAFAVLVALSAQASHPGCCCTPPDFKGYLTTDHTLCDVGENFTEKLPNVTHPTCDAICEAVFLPPITVPPPADCSSPQFKPAPTNLKVLPVKGRKHLRLTWDALLCDAYSVNVSRCAGDDCIPVFIAQIPPTTVYTDIDPGLLWNTNYTYQLTANYIVSGASSPAIGERNPGDLECWDQGDAEFCIGSYYYDRFEGYLTQHGYLDTTPFEFQVGFSGAVDNTFSGKFNKGWRCDPANLLGVSQNAAARNCPSDKVCVADEAGAQCLPVTPDCGAGAPFGLYFTAAACEAQSYCFFDRSHGSVDNCYACSPRMRCADYRTSGACDRDPCKAGDCGWRDVFPHIGIGVCVDTRFSNCLWCTHIGTPGLENNAAYNEVFDQCTERKARELSVEPDNICTYNKNAQESNSCDTTACMDYTIPECGSPAGGIILNPDNSLETFSTDKCDIKVCQTINFTVQGRSIIECIKNHDGNGAADCHELAPDRRICELDHFPPDTALVPSAYVLGRMDWLDVQMLDRFNGTHDGQYMDGRPGYRLRVCVVGPNKPCTDAAIFVETNLSWLNFNDLSLQAGRTVLATMAVGKNTLRYYGIDNRRNPEIVKEMDIIACNLCQGPKVLETSVTPGRLVAGTWYTISDLPVITASLNELATLTSASLIAGDTVMPVTVTPPSGANYDYRFVPLRALDDGAYTLTFNSKDSNGKQMDFPGSVAFVVDTTPGNVRITPSDGSVINVTSVDITFEFDGPTIILNATLEEEIWISKYATRRRIINLAPLLSSTDNITYTTTVSQLSGGKKHLKVVAEDFAGNPTIGKSSFWINTGLLQLRMREPSWGVSPTFVFDVVIDTTRVADCKYVYNVPAAPPLTTFEFLQAFDSSTEVTHTIDNFNRIPAGDLSAHKLHVYCKAGNETKVESFDLRVDPTPPIIRSAYAAPQVIVERRIPGMDIFTTYLKAQTDDDGFCKYSTQDVPFVLMEGFFSGFDEIPKKSHDAEVNVTQDKTSYTYYVACKNTAGLPSVTVPVTFSVDTSIPFSVASATPPYSNTTNVTLRVETNKRSFCFVGETEDTVLTPMGAFLYGNAHTHSVFVNRSGNFRWYVRCSTGASAEVGGVNISVIVDTTPPFMEYVDDSSNLVNDTEYSYFLDQLQVRFLGRDNETAVKEYYYRITTLLANVTVKNWTLSTNLNGTAFYAAGLNLTDGNKYKFDVYAVNIVGLKGSQRSSNGVTIDVEKMPGECQNGVEDSEETDLDCGGICPSCLDGAVCVADTDCMSGFCDDGICAVSACDDLAKNGNETDLDCGGGVCLPCGSGKACVANTDCVTGSCNYGTCGDPEECADGVLTGTETDIDCGGSCPNKCAADQNCQTDADCAGGLPCVESTCQAERDSDGDGVKDDLDECPNTPSDELADEKGCSISQRFTCGDEISDGWRIRYFGSVLCDGDGAADADPDDDGLVNRDEYRYGTDPTNPDTDFDGWDDTVEIDKGTNPLDPESHPPSKLRILLWVLLILLLLGALGIGGYIGYHYYLEKYAPKPPARPAPAAPKPVRRLKPWPAIIERLRGIARKVEPEIMDRDWVSLTELAERAKKEKVVIREDIFAKLKAVVEGRIPRKEVPSIMAAIRKEPEAFALLRRITFEHLPAEEKQFLRKRLALLREGKLTSAEIEEILAKLRVTAAWYRAHRKELERELAEWLGEGGKRR